MRTRSLYLAALVGISSLAAGQAKRPPSFVDLERLRSASQPVLSPNGKWMLFTVSTLDWADARRYRHIYLASVADGATSARPLTFGAHTNEFLPRWSADGRTIVFQSDRDASDSVKGNQLFALRLGDSVAMRITSARDGVGAWVLSGGDERIIYESKAGEMQLFACSLLGEHDAATQVTHHATGIDAWKLTEDGRRIYFVSADSLDMDDRARRSHKFDVQIRNAPSAFNHLWSVDVGSGQERRLTSGSTYTVGDFTVSPDGRRVGFKAALNDRYQRNMPEAPESEDLYLLEVASGSVERLTNNKDATESDLSFSPDGTAIAFSSENDFRYGRFDKIYIRATAAAGTPFRKLAGAYDGLPSVGWWSSDGRTIYFDDGIAATHQLFALEIARNVVTQLTHERGSVKATRDRATGMIVVNFTDPTTPNDYYLAHTEQDLGNRQRWIRMTDVNPEASSYATGAVEEVSWKSTDGRTVGGILVKPVNYAPGRRYPLIVQLHGGPASAAELGYRIGYGAQGFANAGYLILVPNYRGSLNYGERFYAETSARNKYFARGFEDIMTGVDYLIARGLAHPDSLGEMGLSAGGHYGNWIMTHTNRFKAIVTGEGAVNWVSLYGESDVQHGRNFYMGGALPYDDLAAYWDMSPLKYIRRARTPTLIEFINGDPHVPRVQGDELHIALSTLGVPNEYLVYPGNDHSTSNPRSLVTMRYAELGWFEKWIRGKPGWLDWNALVRTVDDATSP